jgi:hypothetical protein
LLDPNLPELKVLDYAQALQRAQNLESRGDLLNKGVYKLLITIHEWTDKFNHNKSLPTQEQLERELGFESEKLDYFISEYSIRAKPPLIKKLNYLDFFVESSGNTVDPGNFLKHSTVFCRPTQLDGVTSYRYATGLNDISVAAIKRWISEKRTILKEDALKQKIFSAIDGNRLFETYASTEIGNLFQCSLDRTKQQKDSTMVLHLKPILKNLVESRLIFFIRNDRASKLGNRSVFYYFNKEEIFARLEIYISYMKDKIIPDLVRLGVIPEPTSDDFVDVRPLTERVYKFMTDSYGDQKAMVEEILLLAEFYYKEVEKLAQEEKKKSIDELMEYIKASGKIIDINLLKVDDRPLDDDTKAGILRSPFIVYTEYADKFSYHEYILHKENIPTAIENARKLFLSAGNDSEISILRSMDVIQYVEDANVVQSFAAAENLSLFQYLPFLSWLWRSLTGNKTVHKVEANAILRKLDQNLKNSIAVQKVKFEAKEKLRKEQAKQEAIAVQKQRLQSSFQKMPDLDGSYMETSGKSESEDDPATKQNLKMILSYLDEAWDFGYYPDRDYLLSKIDGSMTEDEMVHFLKKKGGKDVFSYMIRNQLDKHPFPILVSRQYIKKNGKKMLKDFEKIINEQKSKAMPEQLKFDQAVSLVEFLDRILPKIK